MDIAISLAEAAVSASWQVFEGCRTKKPSSYMLADGMLLEAVLKSRNAEPVRSAAAESCSDLFAGSASENAAKVKLVPSVRTRLRRALNNLSFGFELPLVRRAAAFGCFAVLAAAAMGISSPASAETIPDAEALIQSECGSSKLMAATLVNPTNQVLRYGSMFKALNGSSHSNIKGGIHTNMISGHTNKFVNTDTGTNGDQGRRDANGNPIDAK